MNEKNNSTQARLDHRWSRIDLRFADGTAQSRMSRFAPNRLVVPYTRTMLAALRLTPQPRTIAMVGLGGGSQAKFLYKHLATARLEVFESDSGVITLRKKFHIPDDDHRFTVIHADAAKALAKRAGQYDLLLIDGYDAQGIPPSLSTQKFYNDCRSCLRAGGTLATNLYSTDYLTHLHRLKIAFGEYNVAMLEETSQSNRVAFAWTTPLVTDLPISLSETGQRQLRDELARIGALKIQESN